MVDSVSKSHWEEAWSRRGRAPQRQSDPGLSSENAGKQQPSLLQTTIPAGFPLLKSILLELENNNIIVLKELPKNETLRSESTKYLQDPYVDSYNLMKDLKVGLWV